MTDEKLEKIIKEAGFELYDTEIAREGKHKIFRVYINSKKGISLDDCQKVSQIISPILDMEPPIEDKYFLEVSSPGIERKLKNPKHFKASVGELIKIKKDDKKIIGKLLEADDNSFKIKVDDEVLEFVYDEISKCKTYIKW